MSVSFRGNHLDFVTQLTGSSGPHLDWLALDLVTLSVSLLFSKPLSSPAYSQDQFGWWCKLLTDWVASEVWIRPLFNCSVPGMGCLCPEGSLFPICTKAPCGPAMALPASQGVLRIKGTSECAGSGPGTSLSAISRYSLFPSLIS